MFGIHLEFNSKKRKEKIFSEILQTNQVNEKVINIHRVNPNNIGDYFCGPHLYFEQLKGKQIDISDFRSIRVSVTKNFTKKISNNSLIIGGGGLLNIRHFKTQMELFEQLSEKGKKTVIWGAGHNQANLQEFSKNKKYWIDINKFGLVGTRDYSMRDNKTEWVPCVSCLNQVFDKSYNTINEVGLIYNAKSIKNKNLQKKLSEFPYTSNTSSLNEMIKFIGESDTIVTNSYHAMYWSILLGKKIVSIPATSKFLDFKYESPIATFENFTEKIKYAPRYSGVLEECREINVKFSEKVFDYLGM